MYWSVINELGAEMAVEEVDLVERFAAELQARIERQSAGGEAPSTGAGIGAARRRGASGELVWTARHIRQRRRMGRFLPSSGAIPANPLPGTAGKVAP